MKAYGSRLKDDRGPPEGTRQRNYKQPEFKQESALRRPRHNKTTNKEQGREGGQ